METLKFKKNIERHPKYLFKYFNNIKYALDVISNKRIHFESPSSYNDIFDSTLTIHDYQMHILGFSITVLKKFLRLIPKHAAMIKRIEDCKFSNCKNFADFFNVLHKEGVKNDVISELKNKVCETFKNIKVETNKITCFSEICDSNLMWSHYANKLKGVCLIFDTDKDTKLYANLHKINYSIYRRHDSHANFNFYFEKSLDWNYEQEWRLVANIKEDYLATDSCIGVIIGEKNSIFSKSPTQNDFVVGEIMKELISKSVENKIELLVARADSEKYQLNIEDFVL